MLGLLLLGYGVDKTLDRLATSPQQSSFTLLDERGVVVVAYDGDLSDCKAYAKPMPMAANIPRFLHRT